MNITINLKKIIWYAITGLHEVMGCLLFRKTEELKCIYGNEAICFNPKTSKT